MAHEQISNNEDELMMREIMGLVYQLTKTKDGAKAVQMYELQPHIYDALNSAHKSIGNFMFQHIIKWCYFSCIRLDYS